MTAEKNLSRCFKKMETAEGKEYESLLIIAVYLCKLIALHEGIKLRS